MSPSSSRAVAGYGVALGVVDAEINMQAVALEHRYGRPILPSFHGAWTLGGLVGAALDPGDRRPRPAAGRRSLAVVPLAARRRAVPAPRRAGAPSTDVAVPWRPILLVGAALVLFYMVDTAAFTWGPTYLDASSTRRPTWSRWRRSPTCWRAGWCGCPGDGLVRRHGAVRVLRAGALVAFFGLAVVVFAPTWPVAVLGFR